MSSEPLATAHEPPMAKVRRLAREQKLRGFSFFDQDGNIGARGDAAVLLKIEPRRAVLGVHLSVLVPTSRNNGAGPYPGVILGVLLSEVCALTAFLDHRQRPRKSDGRVGIVITSVEFEFSNGEKVSLTKQEMAMLQKVKFNLQAAT